MFFVLNIFTVGTISFICINATWSPTPMYIEPAKNGTDILTFLYPLLFCGPTKSMHLAVSFIVNFKKFLSIFAQNILRIFSPLLIKVLCGGGLKPLKPKQT